MIEVLQYLGDTVWVVGRRQGDENCGVLSGE